MLLSSDQPPHLSDDLRHRADVVQVIQRHRNLEVIFELADQFKNLERVEPEVGQQLALLRRLNWPTADALENVNRVLFEAIGGSDRVGSLGQAGKCNMNTSTRATARSARRLQCIG